MWKISDARDSWATDTGWDLLASIVVPAQIRLTFGFGFRPKVPLHFRWHIRFQPNVIRHFRPTFGYGRKWNFHFRWTSILDEDTKFCHYATSHVHMKALHIKWINVRIQVHNATSKQTVSVPIAVVTQQYPFVGWNTRTSGIQCVCIANMWHSWCQGPTLCPKSQ